MCKQPGSGLPLPPVDVMVAVKVTMLVGSGVAEANCKSLIGQRRQQPRREDDLGYLQI
jgi:hypothetical protein